MPRSALASLLWIPLGVGSLAVAAAVNAQESRIRWHMMGGYSDTLGATADYLQGGYVVGGGFSVAPSWSVPLELRFDLSYSQHNASIALLNSGQQATNTEVDGGTGSIVSASGSVVYHFPLASGVRGYAIAGAGAYYTRIELTQALPYGYGYGGYGYGGFGYGYGYGYGYDYGYNEAVVASHEVTNFGWDAGLGVEFALSYGRAWFIESRYHRINSTAPIEYLPIEVGFRF